jgi:hypothetical protein
MTAWFFRYDDGLAYRLCDACGRRQAEMMKARLPKAHEHGATTRKGSGRTRWSVTISADAQPDGQCRLCSGPTTDELNAFLKTGD